MPTLVLRNVPDDLGIGVTRYRGQVSLGSIIWTRLDIRFKALSVRALADTGP